MSFRQRCANRIKAAGYEVLVYTWDHVRHDPMHVIGTLAATFQRQAELLRRPLPPNSPKLRRLTPSQGAELRNLG